MENSQNMKSRINILGSLSLLVTVILFSSNSSAQVYFEETFLPVYISENTAQYRLGGSDTGSIPTQSGFGYDLRTTLGYTFWDQMIVGLTYQYYKTNSTRPLTDAANSVDETYGKNEWGPTIGYVTGGWRLMFTYFIDAKRTYDSKGTDYVTGDPAFGEDLSETRSSGTGYQLTIGYSFAISTNFQIGPSLVYRSVSYGTGSRTNRLDPLDSFEDRTFVTKAIDAGLSPMISLLARF
jgi:hypothetical protein